MGEREHTGVQRLALNVAKDLRGWLSIGRVQRTDRSFPTSVVTVSYERMFVMTQVHADLMSPTGAQFTGDQRSEVKALKHSDLCGCILPS
jgi:hypothetical protein